MDRDEILGIFRIDKQEYLELILDGKLRFTPIETYKKMEDEESHRKDSDEGLRKIHQAMPPDKDWIRLIAHNGPLAGIPIELKFIGQIKVSTQLDDVSVLCFSKITRADIPDAIPGRSYQYNMDPRMLKLGNVALVIRSFKEFVFRFRKKAEELKIKAASGSVKYVDVETYHGDIKEIGYTKLKDPFYYQKEYRLALMFNGTAPKEFILDIGSIRDIAEIKPLFQPK